MIGDILENLRVAWEGLRANKMRAFLTMLGVIIGVAAVISLLSVGQGAQQAITGEITGVGSNLLFISPGAMRFGPVQRAAGSAATLTAADAAAIADPRNVPSAVVVAPVFSQNTQVIFGNTNVNAAVAGVTPAYLEAFDLEVEAGRFLSDADVQGKSNVAVLGQQRAEDLFGRFDPLGSKIKVTIPGSNGGRVTLTVVGVLAEQGDSRLTSVDNQVLVPLSTAQFKIFAGRNVLGEPLVTGINVAVASEDQVDNASADIETLLLRRHGFDPDEEGDFGILSQADLLGMADEVTGILTVFLGAIAAVSLLVGGIGIMNIMLVSVTERTREIGIRKAVGARKTDIMAQFLLEAVVLSLLGGFLGVLLGVGIARVVDATGVLNSVVTASAVLLAVGFSLVVGLFFGLYPANRAAGLNPIEALRYE